MTSDMFSNRIDRRTVIKTAALAGVAQIASPFVVTSWAADNVKIGLDNPLTGTYAAVGKNELIGCQLAIEQINAKGGILGRKAELLVEDSTSGDAGTAVQKARKLIDRDKIDFLLGNVNSALALAMAGVSSEKGVLHIVPGGHTDAITGTTCHWNVFRVCNTTQMEANAVAGTLIKDYGKKWYYITPDYAFGHTLQAGMEKASATLGGSKVGGDLTPLGTTDFSSYLIKAQAAKPDVIIFSRPRRRHGELRSSKRSSSASKRKSIWPAPNKSSSASRACRRKPASAPGCSSGTGISRACRTSRNSSPTSKRKRGRVPTARTWFGFVSTWTCALAANTAKSLEAVKMAKALQGFKLPPEIALMPDGAFYRAGQNQLIPNLYVGNAQAKGSAPDDLFHVTNVVKGADIAGTVEESGCKMTWPA